MMKKCVIAMAVIQITIIACLISLLLIFLFCNKEIRWQFMTLSEGLALLIIALDIIWLMRLMEKMKFLVE
jgi:uncharacterized membrane protein